MATPHAPVHRMAQIGFDVGAKAYSAARPSYPPEAIRFLLNEARSWRRQSSSSSTGASSTSSSSSSTTGDERLRVVDVAAGTGKFTQALLDFVSPEDVVAVEPVPGMREEFAYALPDATCREGTAESMPSVASGSADVVTAAQSFHWFDAPRALSEIRRVLKPHVGILAVVFNVKSSSVGWIRELDAVTGANDADNLRPKHATFRATFDEVLAKHGGFHPEMIKASFPYCQVLDKETLVQRVASQSWVGYMPEAERSALLNRVREFYATNREIRDRPFINMPYDTEVWIARRKD